jgi:hypothetical protein
MNITEAKNTKACLEKVIAQALREFSEQTDLTVEHVSVEPVIVLGAPASYRVEVEARL